MNPPSANGFNPFPGLRPFRTDEKYLFFGREEQTAELLVRLRSTRFLAVLGTSGSGKTSLVRAGLLPELLGGTMVKAGSSWEVATMRPGGDPIRNLAKAFAETELGGANDEDSVAQILAALNRSGLGLVETVRQMGLSPGTNLLLVVDQFEEIFRFHTSETSHVDRASSFVTLLLEAARQQQQPIYVVLTMRSDFVGDCAQYRGLAEAVNEGEYLIPRLHRSQRRIAIEGPVKVGGGAITPRLLQRLLNDIGDDPDQLPILQHALMRTWDYWEANRTGGEPLDLRHYEAVGGMSEALLRHADEVYAQLPGPRHQQVAEKIFKALTEKGADNREVRRPTPLGMLAAIAEAPMSEVREVIECFRKSGRTFLMPPEGTELHPDTVIDISHESLMRVWRALKQWVEQEAQSARIYRRLSESAFLWKEGKAGRYHDPDLQIGLSWRDTAHPNPAWARRYAGDFDVSLQFLEESRKARDAELEARQAAQRRELAQAQNLAEAQRLRAEEQILAANRLRKLVAALVILSFLALGAFFAALFARKRAQENAQAAADNSLKAQRQTVLAEKEEARALSAVTRMQQTLTRADFIAGVELLETDQAARGLSYLARSLRTDPTYWPAAQRLLSTLTDRNFWFERPQPLQHDRPIASFLLSKKGDLVLTRAVDNSRRIWDARTRELLLEVPAVKPINNLPFSSDGQLFAAVATEGIVHVWNPRRKPSLHLSLSTNTAFVEATFNPHPGASGLFATRSEDGSLQVWDASRRSAITPPLRARGKARSVGFSPDGKTVYGAFDSNEVALWEIEATNAAARILEVPLGSLLEFSPDAKTIVVGYAGRKSLRFWNAETGTARTEVLKFEDFLGPHSFSSDGQLFVGAFYNAQSEFAPVTIRVFDVLAGKLVTEFEEKNATAHEESVVSGLSAMVVNGNQITIRDLTTGQTIVELPRQDQRILDVFFTPAGDRLAAKLADLTVKIWDAQTGQAAGDPVQNKSYFSWTVFSPEGERLVIVARDGIARFWDPRRGQALTEPLQSEGIFGEPQFTEDGMGIFLRDSAQVMGSADVTYGVLKQWNTRPSKALVKPLVHLTAVETAKFSPDGKRVLTITLANREYPEGDRAQMWDSASGQLLLGLEPAKGANTGEFSRDGTRIVIGFQDHIARVFDAVTGAQLSSLKHNDRVTFVRFDPDGQRALTACADDTVWLWDWAAATRLAEPIKHAAHLEAITFSPDGKLFVTASADKTARVWDGATAKAITGPLKHEDLVLAAAFSPDGRLLVTGSADRTARLWNSLTGKKLNELRHGDWVRVAAFSPDGTRIVTAGGGTWFTPSLVKIWDSATATVVVEPMNFNGAVFAAAFSPDGRTVVAGDYLGMIRHWDLDTGKTLFEPVKHEAPINEARVHSVMFSPDGSSLLTASEDHTARIWPLPLRSGSIPAWLPDLAEAVAGQRLNDQGGAEAVDREMLEHIRARCLSLPAGDPYGPWARWLFADRTARTISPFSGITIDDYLAQLSDEDSLPSLRAALQLSPTNGLVFARLARKLAETRALAATGPAKPRAHWYSPAEWYSMQATNFAPQLAEAWWSRAQVLALQGKNREARESIERALALESDNPNAWYVKALILDNLADAEASYQAYVGALERLPPPPKKSTNSPKEYLFGTLKALAGLDSRSPVAFAQWSRRTLERDRRKIGRSLTEALWLGRRAVESAGDDPVAWRLYSEILLRADKPERAMAAADRALSLQPGDYEAWIGKGEILQKLEQKDAAFSAFTNAMRLISAMKELSEKERRNFLLKCCALLTKQGQAAAARVYFLKETIPARDPRARAHHLDLTDYYNASLAESWHDQQRDRGNDLAVLPRHLQVLGGVEFDVRGIIQLTSRVPQREFQDQKYPQRLEGIKIHAQWRKLHFLHSTAFSSADGIQIGTYLVHYADGQRREVPIVYGQDMRDWWISSDRPEGTSKSVLAWQGKNELGGNVRLYRSTWENPLPGVEISQIDFVSTMEQAAPFVIAITAEP